MPRRQHRTPRRLPTLSLASSGLPRRLRHLECEPRDSRILGNLHAARVSGSSDPIGRHEDSAGSLEPPDWLKYQDCT